MREWIKNLLEQAEAEVGQKDNFNIKHRETAEDNRGKFWEITLSGKWIDKANADFAEYANPKFFGESKGPDGWSFLWMTPKSPKTRILVDVKGRKWVAPLVVLKKTVDEGIVKYKKEDAPDLETAEIFPGWWKFLRARWLWFAKNIREKGACGYFDLVRLESGLNAIWTDAKAKNDASMSLLPCEIGDDYNRLRSLELQRQINIQHGGQGVARIRKPHPSHFKKICFYQTPESKEIGLQLFLADGAKYDPQTLSITEGDKLFSLAVGQVPYPAHTDGPRLLMGGKNLKQAEHRIVGAKKPSVLGCLEAKGVARPEELEGWELGCDALVALMPYKGYTYEDGLVISQSFADKLRIAQAEHAQREVFDLTLPIGKESIHECERQIERELKEFCGNQYTHDDHLPMPLQIGEIQTAEILKEAEISIPRYRYRYPGFLKKCLASVVIKRPSKGRALCCFEIKYIFEVDRPLMVGDKLTGRHGNKGVVSAILKTEEMPHVTIGGRKKALELLISPCALMGRKNLGQLYEMAHSTLLWAKDEALIDSEIPRGEMTREEIEGYLPLLEKLGCAPQTGYPVNLSDGTQCGAFAGYQYIARLHHHALSKMQARGNLGPVHKTLGQPQSGGTHAGQRLGEMENWSILSYPQADSGELLITLRKAHGDVSKTVEFLKQCLRILGFDLEMDEIQGELRIRRLSYESLLKDSENAHSLQLFQYNSVAPEQECQRGIRVLGEEKKEVAQYYYAETPLGKKGRSLYEILKQALLQDAQSRSDKKTSKNERENSLLLSLFVHPSKTEGKPLLPLALQAIAHPAISKAFSKMLDSFGKHSNRKTACDLVRSVEKYRDAIIGLLETKMGLIRRHLLGRRLNHSARGVIVPVPELPLNQVYLPVPMILELLNGNHEAKKWVEKAILEKSSPLLKKWNYLEVTEEQEEVAQKLDCALKEKTLWILMIRQPSLHRHSVQAFEMRCWNKNVIGIPPLVTPGFNADFDGDTMAVFLPNPWDRDLNRMTSLENPGLVGTGELSFGKSLDLAVGWKGLYEKERDKYDRWVREAGLTQKEGESLYLGDIMEGLLKSSKAERLFELQKDICNASTGAITLTPFNFQNLTRCMGEMREEFEKTAEAKADREALDAIQKKTEGKIKDWCRANNQTGLAQMVEWKIKGGAKELREMGAFLGLQKDWEECNGGIPAEGAIATGFWQGLNEEELARYSYASRSGMVSKKLEVAQAGYFSRLLAEGLYDTRVEKGDCGTSGGLLITFVKEDADQPDHFEVALTEDGENKLGEFVPFPLSGNLQETLSRLLWGRCVKGKESPLNHADVEKITDYWKYGKEFEDRSLLLKDRKDSLLLRSPLTCTCEGRGVCARCVGADVASRPFDKPALLDIGVFVGITAAQAIGERGTQLAMKKFHDTSKNALSPIEELKALLVDWKKKKKEENGLPVDRSRAGRMADLLKKILIEDAKNMKMMSDLPQQFVHFELALRAPAGLGAWASDPHGRFLAALAYTNVSRVLGEAEAEGLKDDFSSPKSRLLWDRENTSKGKQETEGIE